MKVGDKILCIKNYAYSGGELLRKGKYYDVRQEYHNLHFYVRDESSGNLYLNENLLEKYTDYKRLKRQSLNNKLKKIRLL